MAVLIDVVGGGVAFYYAASSKYFKLVIIGVAPD
jgi:hypothetical protein